MDNNYPLEENILMVSTEKELIMIMHQINGTIIIIMMLNQVIRQ